jgi:1-phosphofructokinase
LIPNQVNRVLAHYETLGGKGINVAKVLHALAMQTTAIGLIGKRNIEVVDKYLKDMGIVHEFIEVDGATRTNIKLVDQTKKQTTEINEVGFSVQIGDMRNFNTRLQTWARRSDYVVLSGSLPFNLPFDTYRTMMQTNASLSEFILDVDGEALSEGVKAHPFLIKPNLEELNRAFKKDVQTQEEIIAFCRVLSETYDIGLILLSLGSAGSLLIDREVVYRASSLNIDITSTVGAGDAMLAGFLAGLSRSLALEECLRMANICGALMCMRKEDEMFDYEDVILRMHEIEVHIV